MAWGWAAKAGGVVREMMVIQIMRITMFWVISISVQRVQRVQTFLSPACRRTVRGKETLHPLHPTHPVGGLCANRGVRPWIFESFSTTGCCVAWFPRPRRGPGFGLWNRDALDLSRGVSRPRYAPLSRITRHLAGLEVTPCR